MKIGLYFGSFNPIHIGHLIISNHLLNETDLQKIWFVVSPQNPFKTNESLLHEKKRLDLVKKSITDDERMMASDVEFKLSKPSYTINTLTYLQENYPDEEFFIVMGSDSFQSLHKWRNAETIIKRYKILIYQRPGFEIENAMQAQIEVLNAPLLDISSTEIRELIAKEKSIRYLVPDKARKEIEKKGYYKK